MVTLLDAADLSVIGMLRTQDVMKAIEFYTFAMKNDLDIVFPKCNTSHIYKDEYAGERGKIINVSVDLFNENTEPGVEVWVEIDR